MTTPAKRTSSPSPGVTPKNTAELAFDSQRDAAAYVASLVMELRQIAKSAQLEKVAAALEQAYYDAFSIANTRQPGTGAAADDEPAAAPPTDDERRD